MHSLFIYNSLGNICRSPLAEALFRKHVNDSKLAHKFECDSCGTATYNIGAPPDERSVANALSNGLSYTHSGRQLLKKDFENFDYILAMDEENLTNIAKINPNNHLHIYKLSAFDSVAKNAEIPNPYYGGSKGFQEVFDILDRATLHLLNKLSKS